MEQHDPSSTGNSSLRMDTSKRGSAEYSFILGSKKKQRLALRESSSIVDSDDLADMIDDKSGSE